MNFGVVIIDQEYEGFTVELEDLNLCKQEKSFEQAFEAIKCIESQV